jgi:plasmid stabilization system protein ParE
MLSENPRVGVDRRDVRKGLRSWAYHGYLILYEQVLGDDIRIIRIRRGAADVETMISDDEQ